MLVISSLHLGKGLQNNFDASLNLHGQILFSGLEVFCFHLTLHEHDYYLPS